MGQTRRMMAMKKGNRGGCLTRRAMLEKSLDARPRPRPRPTPRPTGRAVSVAGAAQHHGDRLPQDAQIGAERHGAVVDVIEAHTAREGAFVAVRDLPQPGQTRAHVVITPA